MSMLRLRESDVHWRDIDGEIVALDGRTSVYLTANSSAALLWRALSEGATRDELAALLGASYALDPSTATADTDAFLAELDSAGLLAAGAEHEPAGA